MHPVLWPGRPIVAVDYARAHQIVVFPLLGLIYDQSDFATNLSLVSFPVQLRSSP